MIIGVEFVAEAEGDVVVARVDNGFDDYWRWFCGGS